MKSDVAVQIEGLTKHYVRSSGDLLTVFSDLSLEIPARKLTAILGPSGCGKSTLLRLIAGLDEPDMGTVRVGNSVAGRKPRIGYMLQQYPALPWLTVLKNVELGITNRTGEKDTNQRVDGEIRRQQAMRYVRKVGLFGWEDAYPRELSGGMLQRVSLARTLAMEPDIVLLDEPLGALDALTRRELRMLIKTLHQTEGTTFVLVTHEIAEAQDLADEVIVLGPVGTGVQYNSETSKRRLSPDEMVSLLRGTHLTFAAGTWTGYIPLKEVSARRGSRIYDLWAGLTDSERVEKLVTEGASGACLTIQSLAQMQAKLHDLNPKIIHVLSETASAEVAERILLSPKAGVEGTWRWALPDGGLERAVVRRLDPGAFQVGRIVPHSDRAAAVAAVVNGQADACIVDRKFARRLIPWWKQYGLKWRYLPDEVWRDLWTVVIVPSRILEEQEGHVRNAVRALAEDASHVANQDRIGVRYPTLHESQELLRDGTIRRAFERWGGSDFDGLTFFL